MVQSQLAHTQSVAEATAITTNDQQKAEVTHREGVGEAPAELLGEEVPDPHPLHHLRELG